MSDEEYCQATPCFNKVEPLNPLNSMPVLMKSPMPSLGSSFTPELVDKEESRIHTQCFNPAHHIRV